MPRPRRDPRTDRRLTAARRVRDLLRSAIVHGALPDGELPAESALMLTYAVSRQVVRDALEMLRVEGLVRRTQGAGTFSLAAKVVHDFGQLRGPHAGDDRFRHVILTAQSILAPGPVADRLQLEPGARCGMVEVVATFDDEPFYISTIYVHEPLLPVIARGDTVSDWYDLYDRIGIRFGATDHLLEAVSADDVVAEVLGVEPGAALLLLERVVRDRAGRPFEFALTHARGDRVAMLQHLTRPAPPSFDRRPGESR